MEELFSIGWKKIYDVPRKRKQRPNFIKVQIKFLDKQGRLITHDTLYEEWLGVCTGNIHKVVSKIKKFFPGTSVRYERLGDQNFSKVLPYFEERLLKGKLNYSCKPFYKVYTSADVESVGFFFNQYKIAFYSHTDWLIRIYLDICTRFKTQNGFFYKWYAVDKNKPMLMDSLTMLPDKTELPPFKIAAFDLETVPMSGENRIPNGIDPLDKIVMISVVIWSSDNNCLKKYVLYLNPCSEPITGIQDPQYIQYQSEAKMIHDFHALIQNVHVLTGYNINNFDIPCLFARLLWLKMYNILNQYSSEHIGDYIVTTFQNKMIIDMYNYTDIFSSYDLASLKLDNVAKTKLGGDGKVPIDARGIHYWYITSCSTSLCVSTDKNECYRALGPSNISLQRFGTFLEYLEYCLRDSCLVYRLFQKEMVLSFLISRANFVTVDAMRALHYGNSRFLLEVFKSYGIILGFFLNPNYLVNDTEGTKFKAVFINGTTYQGALNFCIPEKHYRDVSVLDFTSMYPMCLLSSNLCYGTCTILTKDEYLALSQPSRDSLAAIPYRLHSEKDFFEVDNQLSTYPAFDPTVDNFVIVVNQNTRAFLPSIVHHFFDLRKYHQREWKKTKDIMHYNAQLCIKILINSLYGTMASKDSPLGYIVIAMTIVTLARYQLLASYRYVRRLGYNVCYADTDSLMVEGWPVDNCDEINRYLNLPFVDLKFEQKMTRLLILSKKRYIYETSDGKIHSKGFQKRVNDLTQYMSTKIIDSVMQLGGRPGDPSDGWIVWVETLVDAYIKCRDPKRYAITRKTKKLNEYKSTSCPTVKILQKYPEKAGDYIEYTYSRADVGMTEASKWVMDVAECKYVDFQQLFISQKKIFCTLLNIGFWKSRDPYTPANGVLNTMRWKCFVHAELLTFMKTGKKLLLMVEKGVKFTFSINDYTRAQKTVLRKKK